jgi:hypothetical protein
LESHVGTLFAETFEQAKFGGDQASRQSKTRGRRRRGADENDKPATSLGRVVTAEPYPFCVEMANVGRPFIEMPCMKKFLLGAKSTKPAASPFRLQDVSHSFRGIGFRVIDP